MEHESDGDSNCNWRAWHVPQRFGAGTIGLGDKKTSGDHPIYRVINIAQSTEKSPGDL